MRPMASKMEGERIVGTFTGSVNLAGGKYGVI